VSHASQTEASELLFYTPPLRLALVGSVNPKHYSWANE